MVNGAVLREREDSAMTSSMSPYVSVNIGADMMCLQWDTKRVDEWRR